MLAGSEFHVQSAPGDLGAPDALYETVRRDHGRLDAAKWLYPDRAITRVGGRGFRRSHRWGRHHLLMTS